MTDAPEKLVTSRCGKTIVQDGMKRFDTDIEWVPADLHLALVAAEREAVASEMLSRIAAHKTVGRKGSYPSLNETLVNAIRAHTPDDAQAALEKVKHEAWQQGYETGTGEIAGALDEAAAAKRMYLKARNEALREAAAVCERIRIQKANGPMPERSCFDYEQAVEALMEDTDDE